MQLRYLRAICILNYSAGINVSNLNKLHEIPENPLLNERVFDNNSQLCVITIVNKLLIICEILWPLFFGKEYVYIIQR